MRALLVLAELWAASEIILLIVPYRLEALREAGVALLLCAGCALTYAVTRPVRIPNETPFFRHLVPLQITAVALVVALTGWTMAVHAGALRVPAPLWTPLDRHLFAWLGTFVPVDLAAALRTFAEDVLLPLLALAILRVPLAKMGLGGFSRGSAAAAAIWLALPLFAFAFVLLYADEPAALVARGLIRAFFANGFSEEFLFRGALFGRLRAFLPAQWAAFVQAIVYALWHFGVSLGHAGGNAVTALALLVPAYAVFGFAMALLVRRTGNLAIPALFHTSVAALQGLA